MTRKKIREEMNKKRWKKLRKVLKRWKNKNVEFFTSDEKTIEWNTQIRKKEIERKEEEGKERKRRGIV